MERQFRIDLPEDPARLHGRTSRRARRSGFDKPSTRRGSTYTARGYEAIDDPFELQIAVRELHRVRDWIAQFADVAAEMPGFAPESVLGVKATTAMVTLLVEQAEARLNRLTTLAPVGPPDDAGAVAAG